MQAVTCTLKVSVSWALLPLLTDHRLSCRRHKSLAIGSSGGRRTKVAAALSYNHASTWTGSHYPQMFAPLFPRLYEGILHDAFIPSSRIMVSLLLRTLERCFSALMPVAMNGSVFFCRCRARSKL